MASKTEICNMALGHLGIGTQIANLTEKSAEARACNRFFDIALDTMLTAIDWPFAARKQALSLVAVLDNDEWAYSYGYPSGALKIRRILSGTRNDTADSQAKYRFYDSEAQKLIYTDVEDAEAEFTYRVTDTGRYPAEFTLALSYQVAYLISGELTKGDQFKRGEAARIMADQWARVAASRTLNEEARDEYPESEFIRAR